MFIIIIIECLFILTLISNQFLNSQLQFLQKLTIMIIFEFLSMLMLIYNHLFNSLDRIHEII